MQLRIIFLLKFAVSCVWSQAVYTCSANASCGCSTHSAILTRIVGGESAADQTWGWMASLRYSSTNSHFCGGSIISKNHILTAAHCVVSLSSSSSIRAYVGSVNLYSVGKICDISNIFIHPNYSTSTYVNDIAILKLSSSLDLTQAGLDTICLPNVSAAILASQEYPAPKTNVRKCLHLCFVHLVSYIQDLIIVRHRFSNQFQFSRSLMLHKRFFFSSWLLLAGVIYQKDLVQYLLLFNKSLFKQLLTIVPTVSS